MALLGNIKKDYKYYWITALSEEGKGKDSDYFITLENADQVVQLRSSDSESWVITSASVKAEAIHPRRYPASIDMGVT